MNEPRPKCEACGLQAIETYIQVRTTNGSLLLCQQCLGDLNRKNPELSDLRAALAASEQEVEQYRQVIQAGRRLPDPDLSQDPAYAAFVLGKLEQARAELVAAAAPLHAFIRAANIGNNNEPIVLVELDRLPQPYELTLGQLRGLATLLAHHAPETPQ